MLSPLKRDILSTKGRLPPQVILLGFVSLLNDAASEMIYPLLPVFMITTLGATPVLIGVIEGAGDALASVLKLFAGSWSDRLRRRKPLVVSGYGLAAGSRVLIAAATGWTAVLAARLVDRSGKGIRSAPRDALISDVTPTHGRGRAFGFHRALDHTGAVVGPLAALLLLQAFDLPMRQVFYIAVIPGAIAVVLLLLGLKENVGAPGSSPAHRDLSMGEGTRAPLGRRFKRAMIPIGLFSLANSTDAFLLLQAHAAGVSTAMLPALWAAHHVVKALFSTYAGGLSDRFGRRWLLVSGWTSYAVIYALFPAVGTLPAFIALFVAYAIPFTLAEGAERALVADLAPANARGRGFGVYYLVNGIGTLIGSVLFGLLYDRISPTVAFATAAVLALAAAVAISDNRFMLRTTAALAIAVLALPIAAQERLTETIEVRVVSIDAVVTDRDRNRITGLAADDFEVVDDGQLQTITNFLEIRGGDAAGAEEGRGASPPLPARRFVFFVDGYSIHPSNRDLYVRALRNFVGKELRPGDLASIVSWNTELSILAPLTSDRGLLASAIDKVAKLGSGAGAETDLSRVQRACMQSLDRAMNGSILFIHAYEECINIARGETMVTALSSRRLLNAMELAMTTIAGAEGKKYFVLAGARLPRSPGIEIYQWVNQLFIPYLRGFDAPIRRPDQDDEQLDFLERVARAANAHGVTLYTIAATLSSDLLNSRYERPVDDLGADYANQANTFDAFEKLSSLTGGFSVHRPSDFAQALASIARESESYYSLGYRPRQPGSGDRPITVRTRNRQYTVRARTSHALKTADDLMTDKVVANLFTPVAASAWRPVLATAPVEREGKTFKVPFEVTIPPRVTLLPAGDELAGGYTVYVAVGTQQGAISTVFRQPQPVRIAAAREAAFRKEPLLFGATLTVRPGENILSVGVVDHVSGEQAFTRTTIVAK